MKSIEKYNKWKPDSIKMSQSYESVWDGHLEHMNAAKHRMFLGFLDPPP